MLSSSDAESVAVADLLALEPDASRAAARAAARLHGVARRAGAARGDRGDLRDDRAGRRRRRRRAAEEGIFLAYHALLEPGDHVVVETPCYESALAGRALGRRRGDGSGAAPPPTAGRTTSTRSSGRCGPTRSSSTSTRRTTRPGTLMPRDVLDRVVELCAERGAWLFCDEVYRELEHDPADRLPAACDLYERALSLGSISKTYGLPGPPARLARLARPRRARADRRPQALHDDLLERPERAPQRARAAAPRRARRAATAASCSPTCRCSTRFLERHAERVLVDAPDREPDRLRPRARRRRRDGVLRAGSSPRPASCCCPASVYDEPDHVRVGYGRANMPDALARLGIVARNAFLTEPDESAQLIRKVSEHPADTPFCRRRIPPGGATADGRRTEAHDVDRLVPLCAARARAGPCGGIGLRDGPVRRGAEPRGS